MTIFVRGDGMSGGKEYTSMGWGGSEFPPTKWTEVIEPAVRKTIGDEFIKLYWKPIYCLLRRKGYPNEEAKDLTQGFFEEKVLGGSFLTNLVRSPDRSFRASLLTALKHYVIDVARAKKSSRRSPAGQVISLEKELHIREDSICDPEAAFDYAWAVDVLRDVLGALGQECQQDGLSQHWEVFRARVLVPVMNNEPAPSLPDLCAKMGIGTQAQASNMIVTVKRRFERLLKNRIRRYVGSDSEVDREIRRLADLFGTDAA
jgi:hypothetical protein